MNTNTNMSFYKFMHKQILVIIALNISTAPGYLFMGYLYTSMVYESIWIIFMVLIAIYGYTLYTSYSKEMTIAAKNRWLDRVRFFMFLYSISWSIMFVYYVTFDNLQMHYITIATELGSSVVAATLLASQKKLVTFTVIFLMTPLIVYFSLIGETYSYILAFFSVVLSGVILYAAKNTNDYIIKSNYQAYHDHLTSLGNRRYFLEILESSVREYKNKYTYLLLIDLDYFKTINDTLGHDIGDELLQAVALRMKNLSESYNNEVSRLGGDEFCVLSQSFPTQETCLENAQLFSEKLLEEIKKTYNIADNQLYISASIGISLIDNREIDANEFLKEADMAMYEAKNSGRDGIIIFNEPLRKLVKTKLDIERIIHFAIQEDEITLNYQAQVNADKKIIGCEVLVRWHSNTLGFVGPDIFIPIAENTGYIIELGTYILEESLKTLREWQKKGIILEQISINISMRQLHHFGFVSLVEELVKKYVDENSTTQIIFEITETSTTEDITELVRVIEALKAFKISFSMDDFGTGYSSLSYLREIPISELKIDKSFIAALKNPQQASLVKTIVSIAKNLNLTIVAEGVEEEYQREFLREIDCDLYQGYLFFKPTTKEKFEQLFVR
ncbi:bifunctional diguanylate cyclase/phosphodiesterase [Sulfurimonas sp. SAG-AH-194-L11]|nr:bifunctional diguanylate cyclase/phosphodiesterase [Sulfurimonas sp. SAG-AH-194-L11]MDF1876854.1 bifunctional diguanylate cyclase/phosphodiesterase [Sulfurimonas sp. SAG-AH-194-L11]